MAEVWTKSEIINHFIFENNNAEPLGVPWAFCIHVSIMEKWIRVMNKLLKNNDWEMDEQIIRIGTKNLDMRLIIVKQATQDQLKFIFNSVNNSKFTFPWEDNPTLFIEVGSFKIIEDFITKHKLESYILKIDEKLGISANDEIIKVVTFNQSVNIKLDLIHEFLKFQDFNESKYYFMMVAFPWQQSHWHSGPPINDNVYSVLPIILQHLGTLSYINDLNIMDLLALRWALSDIVSNLSHLTLVRIEIDFMVKRELNKIIEDNHLNLLQYKIDKNIGYFNVLMYYLAYEFQFLYNTIAFEVVVYDCDFKKLIAPSGTIFLAEESNVLIKLKDKHNIKYRIDGTGFDQMSLSLFLDLVKCNNVSKIILDTNYVWLKNIPQPNISTSANKGDDFYVHLIGDNKYNFIEDFITELKTITFECSKINLFINCKLHDFRIFNNLTISKIRFESIKIDANMLENLHQCDIKPFLSVDQCSFENTFQNWELLNNLPKLCEVNIDEDEGTWQPIFEFVSNELHKLQTKEFQFNILTNININYDPATKAMCLKFYKFTVDKENSKLEIRDKANNILDLYYLKLLSKPDEKPDHEFYK